MSSSGADYAQQETVNTFSQLNTFNGGLDASSATVTGTLTTNGRVSAVVSVTAAYAAVATDDVILCDTTAAAFAVTIPAANALPGRQITIKKIDTTANAVTITPAAGTIDGAVSLALSTAYEAVTLVSGGNNWWVASQVATTIL